MAAAAPGQERPSLPAPACDGPYAADFYCPAARLVIEVDGSVHDSRQAKDEQRDAYLTSLGLRVSRVLAADVLADPDDVADSIYRLCAAVAGPSTPQLR